MSLFGISNKAHSFFCLRPAVWASLITKHIYLKRHNASRNMWATRENLKGPQGQNLPADYEGSLVLAIHHWLQWKKISKHETRMPNRNKYTLFYELKRWTTVDMQYALMQPFLFKLKAWKDDRILCLNLIISAPTNWFVSHSNIPGCPAAEATGQVVGLLHGRLGRVIR